VTRVAARAAVSAVAAVLRISVTPGVIGHAHRRTEDHHGRSGPSARRVEKTLDELGPAVGVVGVDLDPLRYRGSGRRASGIAAPIVGTNGELVGQSLGEVGEQVGVRDAAADHQHHRSGAADLVMQCRTGDVESGGDHRGDGGCRIVGVHTCSHPCGRRLEPQVEQGIPLVHHVRTIRPVRCLSGPRR